MIPTITPRELAKYIPENSSTQRTLILRPKDQKTSLVGTLELLELRRGLGRFVLIPASIGIRVGVRREIPVTSGDVIELPSGNSHKYKPHRVSLNGGIHYDSLVY